MKTLFIEARYKKPINLPTSLIDKLPRSVALFMSVQFIASKDRIMKKLEKANINVTLYPTRHTRYLGQIYGCNVQEVKGDYTAFLYIGDGEFHPKTLALKNQKPIIIYNPITKKTTNYRTDYFEQEKKHTLAAIKTFYTKNRVGILLSTKAGQQKARNFRTFKKLFPDKTFYTLAFNTLEFDRLQDFPFIDVYLNTACERIAFEDRKKFPKPVINLEDIPLS